MRRIHGEDGNYSRIINNLRTIVDANAMSSNHFMCFQLLLMDVAAYDFSRGDPHKVEAEFAVGLLRGDDVLKFHTLECSML